MQLTAIFLTVCSLTVAARSVSQAVSFTGKNVELEKVFQAIETQTGYFVLYEKGLLKNAERVTVNANNVPLNDFLSEVLNNQPLTYSVQSTTITIERKITVNVSPRFNLESSPPPITGIIRDADGNPLQGVNVVVKATKRGITTDAQGKFSIEAKENDVLVISSIGYNGREVKVISTNVPHIIALEKSVSELDEVQYIAYGTQTRRFSVGNVTTVKGEDIAKQPVNNPMLALQGRVPGLNVTQETGMNGGGVKIRIQGENSILNGNEPLIIVDGVPYPSKLPYVDMSRDLIGNSGYGSPLGFLSINDIESMDVLKDADATSIYGSRAANGAILITTKKGKPGKMKINLNLQHGWSEVASKMKMMNTRQYLDMRYEAIKNAALIPTNRTGLPQPYIYSPDLTVWDTTRYTDWQEELIGETALYSNYNASLSGGSQTSNYMIGFAYNRNTDVYPGEHEMTSGAVHFNLNTASINQKFKIQLRGTYTQTDNSLPGVDLTASAIRLVPVAPPLFHADTLNWAPNPLNGIDTWDHPLENTFYQRYTSNTRVLYSSGSVSYNVFMGLDLRCQFGHNATHSKSSAVLPLASIRPALRNDIPRSAQFNNSSVYTFIAEPQLSYNVTLSKITLNILSGITIQKNTTESINTIASGYASDLLLNGVQGAALISTSTDESVYRYNALFGRLGFSWDNKYIISVNGRRDGSSRFGPENKFHNFGSAGVGWIFSQENWINFTFPWLSFGKLRSSYGTTGSDQIPDYTYLSRNAPLPSPMPYQNATAMLAASLHNPYLQWEETSKLQGGIDLGFLNDRILFGLTYARNKSSNQLIFLDLPSVVGFSTVPANFPATVQNTSWEFNLNTVNFKKPNWKWTSSINLTIPRSKLIAFPNIKESSYSQVLAVGQPVRVRRVASFKGIDPATGLYVGTEGNGNLSINEIDRSNFISFDPKYYGGLQNMISIKGIQIDILFQCMRHVSSRQFEYSNGESGPGIFTRGRGNQPVTVLHRWQKAGDIASHAPFSASPNYVNSGADPFILSETNAYYSIDASYIRVKNLSVSWELPTSMLGKFKVHQCRLYANGQNLLTISEYNGLDPETQSVSSLPPLRTWTVGLQIGL